MVGPFVNGDKLVLLMQQQMVYFFFEPDSIRLETDVLLLSLNSSLELTIVV